MNLDGKLSQGIPIGNDISFLLAEVVLARVDGQLRLSHNRALRWYDDYELAFDSREEAEEVLKKLNRQLSRFRLRLNPKKNKNHSFPQTNTRRVAGRAQGAGGRSVQKCSQNDSILRCCLSPTRAISRRTSLDVCVRNSL